ncbi:TIGR03943 family putative permease subunit [Streptomyces sp. NPDC057382]|uniref:TIGR03943 family putative permease subunit n=1 Tax=unclassified Streptomyces TaxID=2593676 RepID=UPI00362F9C7A
MRRLFPVSLLVLSGLGLVHASLLTDLYLRYVKEGMRPFLIASGFLLLLLGAAEAVSLRRPGKDGEPGEAHEPGDGDGHDHSGMPRVAWLLLLPALSLLFYAPPALGAYTAAREAPRPVKERSDFDPLPATSPVPLTLTDFTSRVQQDREQGIKGHSVRMTGFVTPGGGGGDWYLTRLVLNCCAADAQTVKVRIHGAPALPADTWVSVTGTWHPGGTLGTKSAPVALDAHSVRKVPRPVNAYTDALPLPTTR